MNSHKPKLLITGASGFTGQHACTYFSKKGFEVIGVTRQSLFSINSVHTEYCDLTNKEEVRNLIEKVTPQYLLHLAGQNHVGISWNDPVGSLETNAMSTVYLLDVLRQINPSCKIVVVGSALQFNPGNISSLPHPYSLSKTLQVLIAQAWVSLYNMNIVLAKPTNLIGPGYSNGVCAVFARKIAEMEKQKIKHVIEISNPKIQRDFLDVRDAVRAYEVLLQMGEPGEIYEISSGTTKSLEEIITKFKAMTNVDFMVQLQQDEQINQSSEIIPVKLYKLGWKPTISFENSLQDILHFYRNN